MADAARILAVYRRRISEDQVQDVAEAAGLIRPDETGNLLEYMAFLAREVRNAGRVRAGDDSIGGAATLPEYGGVASTATQLHRLCGHAIYAIAHATADCHFI